MRLIILGLVAEDFWLYYFVYINKIMRYLFFLFLHLHHYIDDLIRHPYKPLYRRFIGHVFLDALHVEH